MARAAIVTDRAQVGMKQVTQAGSAIDRAVRSLALPACITCPVAGAPGLCHLSGHWRSRLVSPVRSLALPACVTCPVAGAPGLCHLLPRRVYLGKADWGRSLFTRHSRGGY